MDGASTLSELYREAFDRFGASVLWSRTPVPDPTVENARAITRSLRFEGNLDARRLAERIEEASRAARRAADRGAAIAGGQTATRRASSAAAHR